jgi:hypothetical protein
MEAITCPVCGKQGSLTWKTVRSIYYPKHSSTAIMRFQEELKKLRENPEDTSHKRDVQQLHEFVRGKEYRKDTWDKDRVGNNQPTPVRREDAYRVRSQKYRHAYVSHYDSEKYQENKSRASGRRWCYLREEHLMKIARSRPWTFRSFMQHSIK